MRPATDWNETIADDEETRFTRYAEAIRALQRAHAKGRKADRAFHAKAQAGVEAELVIPADLPEHLRVGLFAKAATYRAYVRFSNGAGVRQSDRRGDVRGMALKVVGVDGKKIIAGMEDAKTQDFLMIRTPTIPFRDADEFVAAVLAVANPWLALPRLVGALGIRRAVQLVPDLVKAVARPTVSLATTRYFTAAPIRFGDAAVQLSLDPCATPAADARAGTSPEYLREDLTQRLRGGSLSYDLRAQLFIDARKTPIEAANVQWLEEDAPFVTVARLTLPSQDLATARAQKIGAYVESLSFDPWHALEAHRPLGSIMRARKVAYRFSTQERGVVAEPDGSESFV
jgi:hypothetical protein